MSCRCDELHCPSPLAIAAALACLPRAPGLFPDWRRGLLAAIGREGALDAWRAREHGDLGLMLVEMGAYVFDVASFYDQIVANESYLGTARLPGAQRRHIGLLGYRPRPAVGSSVWLAAEADGTRLIKLPAGTAIRSGAFDGQPPQVFELGADTLVEPRVNKLEVQRVSATAIASPLASVQARAGSVRVRSGDLVVLSVGTALRPARVDSVGPQLLRSRDAITRIGFDSAIVPPAGATYAGARLLKGGSTCGVWQIPAGTLGDPAVISGSEISLGSRVNLHAGEIVLITDGSTIVARRITQVSEIQHTVLNPLSSTITNAANVVTNHLISPQIRTGVTRLLLDGAVGFAAADAGKLVVHHTMVDAATLHAPLKDVLEQNDPIAVPGLIDPPRTAITELLFEDVHGDGVAASGVLDATAHSASAATAPAWGRALWAPVQLFGNVVAATRGEAVHGELLGSGDASLPLQTFRLKKKPLTYLPAANAAGYSSTLVVHVAGVQWQEIASFYGVLDDRTVYTVTHDDDGQTDLQFGGGARLPSGAVVNANYRFGAGAAVPPADSVKQLAKPVAGLRKMRNVLPAYGGADAEGPAELAIRGPRSALLLGRAISLVDIETAAAQQPGVRAAHAAWRWDELGLRPAVIVSYIGDTQLAPAIQATLRSLAEPDAPIRAVSAPAQSARLDVDVQMDPLHVPGDVIAAVSATLFAAVTLPGTGGLLRAERLGPDGVLFASVVVRAVMEVPGVTELRSLQLDRTPFTQTGRRPAAGAYFDFATGGVWVNGQRAT